MSVEILEPFVNDRPSWSQFFFTQAVLWAQKSFDPSSQIGCVVTTKDHALVTAGHNGPVRGLDYTTCAAELVKRPEKYMYFEHAERNAVYNALRTGTSVKDCVLYILGIPCTDCARAICQSGIAEVKILGQTNAAWNKHPEWEKGFLAATEMFAAAGVTVEICDVDLWVSMTIRINGQKHVLKAVER